jgi:DNA-binding transcriptional MerR regulator
MGTGPLRKIGDVAELLGTTPRALRFYEQEGLISARRTSGGTRLYSDDDVGRFRAILRLAQAGIPIALIKELATARERVATGAQASHDVHAVLTTLHAAVQRQIQQLTRLQQDLSDAATAVVGCFQCDNPPTRKGCPSCPLNRLADSSEVLSLVWEQDLRQSDESSSPTGGPEVR